MGDSTETNESSASILETVASPKTAHPATIAPGSEKTEDKSVIDALPNWLKPGVAQGTHIFLRMIFLSLNALLLYCAIVGTFRPHFEIMFTLSLGLTGCYFFFMHQIAVLHREEQGKKIVTSTSSSAKNDKKEN